MSKLTIKRPERVVTLCLDASLRAEWEKAEAALVDARKAPQGDRLTGNSDVTRLAELVRGLEEQMLSQVVRFRLRALPRSQWAQVLAENPPEPGNPVDAQFGAAKAAFFDAVIPLSVVDVTGQDDEPVGFDPADWGELADEMTDRQWSDFADAVFELNRGSVSVPFSRAASRLNQGSRETSK